MLIFAQWLRFGVVLRHEYSYKLKYLHVKPHQNLGAFKNSLRTQKMPFLLCIFLSLLISVMQWGREGCWIPYLCNSSTFPFSQMKLPHLHQPRQRSQRVTIDPWVSESHFVWFGSGLCMNKLLSCQLHFYEYAIIEENWILELMLFACCKRPQENAARKNSLCWQHSEK